MCFGGISDTLSVLPPMSHLPHRVPYHLFLSPGLRLDDQFFLRIPSSHVRTCVNIQPHTHITHTRIHTIVGTPRQFAHTLPHHKPCAAKRHIRKVNTCVGVKHMSGELCGELRHATTCVGIELFGVCLFDSQCFACAAIAGEGCKANGCAGEGG